MLELLIEHWPLLALLGALGVVMTIAQLLLPKGRMPYVKKRSLLSKSNRRFHGDLQNAIGDSLSIFTMVRMDDLIKVRSNTSKPHFWINKIQAEKVDFVLCNPKTFEAQLAINLDDSENEQASSGQRDSIVEKALAAADLPLLHLDVQKKYSRRQLRSAIRQQLQD